MTAKKRLLSEKDFNKYLKKLEKINDKIKNDYCEDNYISLIRIRYDQIDDIYRIISVLLRWLK